MKKDNLVVQHNKLIEARYSITLQEKRLILWLTSQIKQGDSDFKEYTVNVKELAEFIGSEKNKNIYKDMEKITKLLIGRVIEIEKPEGKGLIQASWINSADYNYGCGSVKISFAPVLKPYLLQLKDQFTKMSLEYVMCLTSTYAIRMYELLKQYKNIGVRVITISELREFMGIGADEYKLYSNLKIKVLQIAEREINERTDISYEYREIKIGRKVDAIKFIIKQRKESIELSPKGSKSPEENVLLDRLMNEFQLAEKSINSLLKKYSIEEIEKSLEYVKEEYKHGKIKNLGAYTKFAIENGLKLSSPSLPELDNDDDLITNDEWKKVRIKLKEIYGAATFKSWMSQITFNGIDNNKVLLSVPTQFILEWVIRHYLVTLLRLWKEENSVVEDILLSVKK